MDFKDIVVATLNDTEVRNETVNVLQYILKQKDSEEMLALYLNTVFLRPDILENMTILLTDSTCQSIADEKTKKYFQDFLLQVIENRTIKEGVLENYVYSPVRSYFSFGYQQAEEERLNEERKLYQEYLEKQEQFNKDQKARKHDGNNIYPGFDETERRRK